MIYLSWFKMPKTITWIFNRSDYSVNLRRGSNHWNTKKSFQVKFVKRYQNTFSKVRDDYTFKFQNC